VITRRTFDNARFKILMRHEGEGLAVTALLLGPRTTPHGCRYRGSFGFGLAFPTLISTEQRRRHHGDQQYVVLARNGRSDRSAHSPVHDYLVIVSPSLLCLHLSLFKSTTTATTIKTTSSRTLRLVGIPYLPRQWQAYDPS
jgi:hypothetical protein